MSFVLPEWAYAYGRPLARAVLRQTASDFIVDEVLGFEPDGEGDHAMLNIRKRGENTEFVARQLARLASVRPVAIGYAGLKDRQAVTSQWFTVDLSGHQEPDWSTLNSAGCELLTVTRQRRKLKRGALQGNHFIITLRNIVGEHAELNSRLESIQQQGVPNYFGEQRFGRNNIDNALRLFRKELKPRRYQRSLYLSAARSFLFNQLLAERVCQHCWNTAVDGDVMMLDGSHSHFAITAVDDDIRQRCASADIHPAGPLWGLEDARAIKTTARAAELEQQALQMDDEFKQGLERAGMKIQRRALRLMPSNFIWAFEDTSLRLEFFLPSGSYATALLRELVNY